MHLHPAANTAAAGSLSLMRPCPSFAGAPAATVRQNPSTSCATLHALSYIDLFLKSPRRRTCGGSTRTHRNCVAALQPHVCLASFLWPTHRRTCGGSTVTRSRCSRCCCKPTPSSCSPTGLITTATCGLQVGINCGVPLQTLHLGARAAVCSPCFHPKES